MVSSTIFPNMCHPGARVGSRTIDQFESPQEMLLALRDAITCKPRPPLVFFMYLMHFYSVHRTVWNAYNHAHGNICIDTICITNPNFSGPRGFLLNKEISAVHLFPPPNDPRLIHSFLSETKWRSHISLCCRYFKC